MTKALAKAAGFAGQGFPEVAFRSIAYMPYLIGLANFIGRQCTGNV